MIEPSAASVNCAVKSSGALDPASRKLTAMVARWPPATGLTAVIRAVSVPVPNTLLSTA